MQDATGSSPPKTVTKQGHKKVRYCILLETTARSQLLGVFNSATGDAIVPFVIWDAKSMSKEWTLREVPGTTCCLSSKRWVDSGLGW